VSLSDDETARLEEYLTMLNEVRSKLYPSATHFLDDMIKRYGLEGAEIWVSGAQWRWLEDLTDQFT
jgi:hypothetical protein